MDRKKKKPPRAKRAAGRPAPQAALPAPPPGPEPAPCCGCSGLAAADIFFQPFIKVILDETRRGLINFIGRHPGLTAGEIAAAFSHDRSTISHHLSVMTTHGFLTAAKEGRLRRYRVNREYIVKTLEEITDSIRNCCTPRPRS